MIPPKDLGEFIVDMASLAIIALIYIVYYTYTNKTKIKK
jgi:hypothetical protein